MKDKVRKDLIDQRKKHTKTEVLKKSNSIKTKLFELEEFKQASTILFYVSYGNEVSTHEMIKECLKKKKNVIVPISNVEDKILILSKLEKWQDLEVGSYNILEPKIDKIIEVSIDEIDLVIVPGVGFDKHGCRIGHGSGYYDGLLKDSTNALHLGLAFEFQIVEEIPIEKHDIPVDKIITEERIIDCF